jgi:drug/metabolite transporter (DMT)-like permease
MKNLLPFLFAVATALCWGLYGPVLGKARMADPDLSPFKPYVGIGVAYLLIAIVGGIVGMWIKGDSFEVGAGGRWGFAAGALGALGAFTLTIAMFSGGARIPHAVMPIVFGGAVTVTALYTLWSSRGRLHATPMLWVGIVGVLVSVIIITMNTPHAAPSPPETASQPGE